MNSAWNSAGGAATRGPGMITLEEAKHGMEQALVALGLHEGPRQLHRRAIRQHSMSEAACALCRELRQILPARSPESG